jgi:hypothetical protein
VVPAGGLVAGGTATYLLGGVQFYNPQVSGGAVAGGPGAVKAGAKLTSIGGIVIGGSAGVTFGIGATSLSVTGSGGAVIGGTGLAEEAESHGVVHVADQYWRKIRDDEDDVIMLVANAIGVICQNA